MEQSTVMEDIHTNSVEYLSLNPKWGHLEFYSSELFHEMHKEMITY